jgi:transposase-like protein
MDLNTLFDEFEKLSPYSQKMLYDLIYPVVKNSSNRVGDYIEAIRETRFAHGMFCPYCKGTHVVGHGKYRSRQRYKCKDCGKTFNDVSCSPMAGTHYPQKWGEYLQFIAEGTTLPKISKILEISLSTAFYWRHKVLNSLRAMSIDPLSGIVESDETYFSKSFKGKNQCKRKDPHHRGEKSEYRGISREKNCVLVAMDRAGHLIRRNAGRGGALQARR